MLFRSTDDAIGSQVRSTDLAVDAEYTVSRTCLTSTTTAAGSYTLFLKADGASSSGKYSTSQALTEADETNNTVAISVTLP